LNYSALLARVLYEETRIGVVLADSRSVYLDANPAACRMFGYDLAEFVGMHAGEIVVEAERNQIESAISEISDRSEHRRVWYFRRRNGQTFAAYVVAQALPDGNMIGLIRDLSEDDVAAENQHLAAIVRSSGDAIVSLDLEGRVTGWNRGAEKALGFTAGEMVGHSVQRVLPAERKQEEAAVLAAIRDRRALAPFETVRRAKDGRNVEIAATVAPLHDEAGRVSGAACIWRDIGVLKERERELLRISRLYAALRKINQAIARTRSRASLFEEVCSALVKDGGFTTAWIATYDAENALLVPKVRFGVGVDLIVPVEFRTGGVGYGGHSWSAFETQIPYVCNDVEKDTTATADRVARLLAARVRAISVFPIKSADGVRGVLGVFADESNVFRREEIMLLEGAADDLSHGLNSLDNEDARRAIEVALREEKSFSDTMIEAMPGILYMYDRAGRFLRWNRNFEALTGYSGDEIRGMHPSDFFAEADHAALEAGIDEVFERGESSLTAPLRARDGSATPFYFTGARVSIQDMPCLVGVGIDVSERHRRFRAEESDRIKSAFLATMSHELRTPLNSILGFTGILLQGLVGPLNDEQAKQLGMVRNSARHLLALINDVLDISKIEAGELEVRLAPFSPIESLRKVEGLMQPMANAKHLAFDVRIIAMPDVVTSDQRRVEQILLNLVSNAIKFTEAGQVTIEVDTREAVETGSHGPMLRWRVTDTGIGISPHDLATLFQPFRQVDTGLSRQFEGTGLGLVICRRLADMLGGEIWVESRPGAGSTFTFALPVDAAATADET